MHEAESKPALTGGQALLFISGVIMPAISITVETTTEVCAETFFDPIPTVWHLLLVVFVPLANLYVWFTIRRGAAGNFKLAAMVNAVAIGVSIFYSIIYAPILPLAVLTLIFLLGFLPLAPYFSLLAAILMRRQLKRLVATTPQHPFPITKRGLIAGLGIAIGMLVLIELPASLTRYGLQKAASPATRAEGIRFLRSYGSREFLLRACYERSGWATDLPGQLLSLSNPVPTSEARNIYYRVTGETYDAAVPPQRSRGSSVPQQELDFDLTQGGVIVGRTLKGLSLASSRLDASADAEGGVAYMQWTLLFLNDSSQQREARAEIQLPPGSVVSRLTLWVNGEEREAAFAGRSKVRQAYQQVVTQRRDPVLVTTAGPDRILVQCFPVPPDKGAMKIRLGITTPLILEDPTHARLLFPHFVSRNFRIPDEVEHAVWVESKTPMTTWNPAFTAEYPTTNVFALRGAIAESAITQPESSIGFDRSGLMRTWSRNPFEAPGFIVRQTIQERPVANPQRIVFVVDTSSPMRHSISQIRQAWGSLPSGYDVKLVLAGDASYAYISKSPEIPVFSGTQETTSILRSIEFAGGADNTPALLKAWDLAAAKPGINAIVWIHGPQRVQLQSVEELRQRWQRRPYGPILYSLRTTAGPDEVEKALDGINEVKSVPRLDDLQHDLERLVAQLTGRATTFTFVRTTDKVAPSAPLEAGETSAHLARLWASDEVARILAARDESLNEAAMTLAVRYQLVTPVSGAVVLENAAQYDAAGLKPVDPGTVPTIPEPEMMALILVAMVFLSFLLHRRCGIRRGGAI